MIEAKNTKKALLMSAISLFICFTMLIGTTFAWFTDSVTSANNIIASGNLDVEMYWAEGTEDPANANWIDASTGAIFNYDNWEPGYVEVRHIKIANEGNLALKYMVNIIANGEVSDLADVIDVYYVDPAVQVADRADLANAPKLGTLTEVLANLGNTGNGTLEAGNVDTITIALKMQENAGNEYQTKSIGTDFAIQLVATQLASETDGFDNQYDKDATYPNISVPVTIPAEDVTAPVVLRANGMEVEVPAAIINSLSDEITSISVAFSEPTVENNTLFFASVDLVDQNSEKIDLENNTEAIAVTLPSQTEFAPGEVVFIYHDGEYIARATVGEDGTISYETTHFCEVVVTDTMTVIVNSAEDLINALTDIKTEAKKQIPGAEGNKQYRENAVFILENDIVIDSTDSFMYTDGNGGALHFYGVKGTLDLNGHNITITENALLNGKAYANAVILVQYSNIEIIGEGNIIAQNQSVPVYGWANGSVDIYGGNYITNASERNESAVYVNNSSMLINVYGGTYMDSAYAFNAHDTSCSGTAVITLHEGITYADFLKNGTTDVIQSDLNGGRIVIADGCEVVKTEENGISVNTVEKSN